MHLLHRVCHRPNSDNQLGEWLQLPDVQTANPKAQQFLIDHNASQRCNAGALQELHRWLPVESTALDFLPSFESLFGKGRERL